VSSLPMILRLPIGVGAGNFEPIGRSKFQCKIVSLSCPSSLHFKHGYALVSLFYVDAGMIIL
jgi:hypothetical protein